MTQTRPDRTRPRQTPPPQGQQPPTPPGTLPPPTPRGRQYATRTYQATRFNLDLPDPADRVDVRVLDAAYEDIGNEAAHLTLGNDLVGEQALIDGALTQTRINTPAVNPRAGAMKMYPKTDGEFYQLDENGNEKPLGIGGGCFNEEFLPASGATSVQLAEVPSHITMVARDGLVQSAAEGHYVWNTARMLTFSTPFNGSERVIVDYAMGTYMGGGWTPPTAPATISGSRDAVNSTVIDQLLTALASLGVIIDATTP